MRTVNDVSKLTGVSIRTLQYYDRIGLLKPAEYTASGYRLYDDTSLERLQQILLFRELEFSLQEIERILDAPGFDKNKALDRQIELLGLKKDHLEKLIRFARGIKEQGVNNMDFKAFDTTEIDEYSRRAREEWGQTAAYKEYEEKSKDRTKKEEKDLGEGLMRIFAELGQVKDLDPAGEKPQALIKKLQEYISGNYYSCTNEILSSLGKMYAAGGEFTENIDRAGGSGTAEFVNKAIGIYCAK